MVRELNYTTISHVMESWEELRRVPDYENVAGKILFKRLFEDCPKSKVLFGFPIGIDTNSPELLDSKRFLMHASYMIQMLDTALNMLGPDIELLTEIMYELGSKHVRYGVRPEMFPHMGKALLFTLSEVLGKRFSPQVKTAWVETYDSLSQDMIRAQLKK
ncbi:hypothetical protein ACA910_005112 [Epithemia clementina (nom. ined.)]